MKLPVKYGVSIQVLTIINNNVSDIPVSIL